MNGFLRKTVALAVILTVSGCSAAGRFGSEGGVTEESAAGFAADTAAAAPMMKAARSLNQAADGVERKIVYRADLTIETTDLVGTREKILDLTESENGILEYNEQNERQFYLSLKIPAEKFEEFLEKKDILITDLKTLDIKYITLDIEGLRSGSMD